MNACTEHVILDQLMGPPNPIPPVASVSPKKRFLKTKSILMMIIIDQLELLVALSVAKDVKIIIIMVIIIIIIIDQLELFMALSVAKDVKINFM